ncbi:MAG: hypothetical protein Q7S70_03005 [bacterium]|nr:hypothetical protein [bacterium]
MDEKETKQWEDRVGLFAKAVSKSAEEIANILKGICGEPGASALIVLADASASPDNEIIELMSGEPLKIPKGVIRKNLSLLRGPQQPVVAAEVRGPSFDVLPTVPDEDNFLQMLKVGGELRVGPAEVISAVRASLASRVGLFELPNILVEKMEAFAEQLDQPCSPKFYELQKMVTQRSYAEVLSVLGVDGRFVSERRKTALLARLNDVLWPALVSFQGQLKGWQDSWTAGVSNPGVILAALAMGQSQSGVGMLPPGIMQPPETGGIRDAAEGVIDQINKVFAGMGIPVARALAYDASKLKQVLEDEALPASIGAANKEQMLKLLGVGVAADYVRLERNITRYALSIMELPKVTAGNAEYAYLGAMIMLGNQIPWDTLASPTNNPFKSRGKVPAGIGAGGPSDRRL